MKMGRHTGKICAAMAAAMLLTTAPTAEAGVNWGEIAGGILGGILAGQGGSGGGSSGGSNDGAVLGGLSNQAHARKDMTNNEKLFVLAVKNNDYPTAQAMLNQGVDINGVYSNLGGIYGGTVLDWAIGNSPQEMIQFLLENGADPSGYYEYNNKFNSYLLRAASSKFDIFLVKYFHEWGAPINDRRYPYILHQVISYNYASTDTRYEILQYLLDNNAIIDYQGSEWEGRTPYLVAVATGRIALANLLAEYGANISARDKNGHDANRIALDSRNLDLYKAVQEINARGQQPSHYQPESRPDTSRTRTPVRDSGEAYTARPADDDEMVVFQ